MKTLIFLLISATICLGQDKKGAKQSEPKVARDTVLSLNQWHINRFNGLDAEIKRLQGTTIEAEVGRLQQVKEEILTSFLAAKIPLEKIDVPTLKLNPTNVSFKIKPE